MIRNALSTTLLALALLAGALPSLAQEYTTANKKAAKLYESAMSLLYEGNNAAAMSKLQQALNEDDNFLEAHLVLSDLCLDAADFQAKQSDDPNALAVRQYRDEARLHLSAVVQRQADFDIGAWLRLGSIALADARYDDAISAFGRYLELADLKASPKPADGKAQKRADARAAQERAQAQNGLATSLFRKNAIAHPVQFDPKNMGSNVNTANDEYLPSLTADGKTLVFTRRFPRTHTTTASTKMEEDLFVSTLNDSQWQQAQRLPEPLNSPDNEGAQCISQDGRIMFFTACNRPDGGGRCDVYMCIRQGEKWSKPRNLGPIVNSGAWESNPSFSIDGKTLYFVSDRKGGFGGMDIWKTTFEHGQWTEPVNLGSTINTPGNEMSPFIHYDDHTLYFASDGHPGMGGMDLFVSHRDDDGLWNTPQNLGYPINTHADESGLIVSADARTAIFASQRQGGFGGLDLYSFDLPSVARPMVAVCMFGQVLDAKSGQPVAAEIKVIDLKNGQTVANTSSDKLHGRYIVSLPAGKSYALHISAKDYLFFSQNESWETAPTGTWAPREVNIALHPIVPGERIALRNVFFETGRWQLLPASQVELDKVVELLRTNPQMRIELGGHTDNVGNAESNQKLSEQRAKAVYDYLQKAGIDPNRLSYKGYGESQPIDSNDTESGRAANRRTELKVM